VALAAAWIVYLDRVVTRDFQGRLWSCRRACTPSPSILYAGARVTADELEEELRRLHYRSGDPAAGPACTADTAATSISMRAACAL